MLKWLCLFIVLFIGCSQSSEVSPSFCKQFNQEIFCDFENVTKKGFQSNSEFIFKNEKSQSDEHSFSGKFGFKVDSTQKYGATLQFPVEPGDIIKVSIKRFKNGSKSSLIIAIKEGRFTSINKATSINDQWELIEKKITVISKIDSSKATIYTVFNKNDSVPGYFDDFEISILKRNDTVLHPSFQKQLQLTISPKAINQIKSSRKKAFKAGIINDSLKVWHPIQLNYLDKIVVGKIRIKGDWTEHLETDKWGIKLKLKKKINGFKKFSLVKPDSRSGIREYLLHKTLEKENILTPNYSFIGLSINNTNKGLFGIEEHFTKSFLKDRDLPIGPIFKIGEADLWEGREKDFYNNIYAAESDKLYHQTGEISSYVKCNDSIFKKGKEKLDLFRKGKIGVEEAFDIDYLAKYYAIINVLSAHHSLIWHNSRFYYNPNNNKLYPIAYDGYSHGNHLIRNGFVGDNSGALSSHWLNLFIKDVAFLNAYKEQLKKYVSREFISSILNEYKNDLEQNIQLIQKEDCNYSENFDYIRKNAKTIRERL